MREGRKEWREGERKREKRNRELPCTWTCKHTACMHIICLTKPTVSVGAYACLFWCLIKTESVGVSVCGGAFVVLCFEKYANINKNALKKHTTSRFQGKGGRIKRERESKITKQMREGVGHHLPEIMKQSKTHKSSHGHFHYLIYAQLWMPE